MKILKIFLSLIIIAAFSFGMYRSFFLSELVKIHGVVFTGASTETTARLEKSVVIPEGSTFWKTDVNKIAEKIKKDDWVESVEVKKVFPNKISVEITERTPVAIINKGGGSFSYIDENNVPFGPAHREDLAKYISMAGKSILADEKIRNQSMELIKQLPETGTLSRDDISEILFHPEKGFQTVLSKSGIVVDLGKDNLPLRLDRARRVVQYLETHDINASHVDADYAKKVLVKVRQPR